MVEETKKAFYELLVTAAITICISIFFISLSYTISNMNTNINNRKVEIERVLQESCAVIYHYDHASREPVIAKDYCPE